MFIIMGNDVIKEIESLNKLNGRNLHNNAIIPCKKDVDLT